jgi:phenol 2-monooxygenase
MFSPNAASRRDIFDVRGIDRDRGCMVVVRPDQFVAHVLALEDDAALTAYFARIFKKA